MSYDALTRAAAVEESSTNESRTEYVVGDDSGLDLSLRLELARHNSISLSQQHTGSIQHSRRPTVEETIVEGTLHRPRHLRLSLTLLLR